MSYLSPQTLTQDEHKLILRVTAKHPRDHAIISMALGTGLRISELLGLNLGDVFAPDGTPKTRVCVRREIAKRGRTGDVFLPDKLLPKLRRFWRFKNKRGESLGPDAPLFCAQSRNRLSRRPTLPGQKNQAGPLHGGFYEDRYVYFMYADASL